MSGTRRDLHQAKLRRDRIRRARHMQRSGEPAPPALPRFAAERGMRAKLAELTRGGKLSEMANAWKQDDPKWRAQELAYDAHEAGDPVEALRLVHEALKLDPDCTGAQHLMVSLVPMDLDSRIRLMRETVDKAERNMGESFIHENTGHFWESVSTRPYMRAKLYLAEVLAAAGQLTDAISIFERMMELNPGDNLGARFELLGLYLATDQREHARSLIELVPGEERILGTVAWARVLERWLSAGPDHAEAAAALERARKVNPFAETYLSGAKAMPDEAPRYYRPGDESGAQICALHLKPALERRPEFRHWLRAQTAVAPSG